MVNVGSDHRGFALSVVAIVLAVCAVAGTAVSLAFGRSAAAPAASVGCGGSVPKLTLHGSGTASSAPDVATVVLAIDETQASAQQALSTDNAATGAVEAALHAQGVPAADVQTSGLSMQAQYAYPSSGGAPRLTGFQVDDTLTVTLRQLGTAGTAIDAAAQAAGSAARIDSLSVAVGDTRALQDRARADAVGQAMAHARVLARAAGERLGRLCSMTDDSTPTQPPPYQGFAQAAGSAVAAPVPLSGGTVQETAAVTLVYAVAPG